MHLESRSLGFRHRQEVSPSTPLHLKGATLACLALEDSDSSPHQLGRLGLRELAPLSLALAQRLAPSGPSP